MRAGVLITNGGSHSPEKWAAESATQISDVIEIEPASIVFDAVTAEKDKFRATLETALISYHDDVQRHEADAIKAIGDDRLNDDLEPESEHFEDAVAAVQAVADQTMFASHFRKPEVQAFVRSTLRSHFSTVKHIERSWHADKNPDAAQAKAFRARYHG